MDKANTGMLLNIYAFYDCNISVYESKILVLFNQIVV